MLTSPAVSNEPALILFRQPTLQQPNAPRFIPPRSAPEQVKYPESDIPRRNLPETNSVQLTSTSPATSRANQPPISRRNFTEHHNWAMTCMDNRQNTRTCSSTHGYYCSSSGDLERQWSAVNRWCAEHCFCVEVAQTVELSIRRVGYWRGLLSIYTTPTNQVEFRGSMPGQGVSMLGSPKGDLSMLDKPSLLLY